MDEASKGAAPREAARLLVEWFNELGYLQHADAVQILRDTFGDAFLVSAAAGRACVCPAVLDALHEFAPEAPPHTRVMCGDAEAPINEGIASGGAAPHGRTTMYEVTDEMPRHARVILREPDGGWTRAFYDQQILEYATARGAPPRTATLHPETQAVLGLGTTNGTAAAGLPQGPILISSADYARDRITLFE
jgi:hypothetical protein